jgi:hypothetical protein
MCTGCLRECFANKRQKIADNVVDDDGKNSVVDDDGKNSVVDDDGKNSGADEGSIV